MGAVSWNIFGGKKKTMSLGWIFRRFSSAKKRKAAYILVLNSDIMVNILSRLPAESVLACRRVCRAWRNLSILDDKYFRDMHLCRMQQQTCVDHGLSFIFVDVVCSIYYVEFDEKSLKNLTMIKFPLPTKRNRLVGSCNGLVCFGICTKSRITCADPVYICNLVTKEFLELPKFLTEDEDKKVYKMFAGFGYVPSTNEYKVVRIIVYDGVEMSSCRLQVYTLGAGSGWRDKGKFNYQLMMEYDNMHTNVFVNGALHWRDLTSGKILAFGLAEEEFHVLPTPPCLPCSSAVEYNNNFRLQVLGESLCLFHQRGDSDVDVWVLRKGTSYAKDEQHEDSWSWYRQFTLPIDFTWRYTWFHGHGYASPFAVTKSGNVLSAAYKNEKVVAKSYDPNTATTKEIGNLKSTFSPGLINSVAHVNSFVSLKELEEENVSNVQKIGYALPAAAANV